MARLSEKIIALMLVVFLIATVAYQAYMAIYASTKTETVYEYTVSRAIPVYGVAIRSETLIEGRVQGIENFIYEDGTRVTAGERVAEFYESDLSGKNLKRARELEAEIKLLEEANDGDINNLSTAESLNRDIKEKLSGLTKISANKRYSSSAELRSGLTLLINKRQIATGVAKDFTPRIEALRAELQQLDYDREGAFKPCVAPVSGYFSKKADGLETILTPETTKEYDIGDYLAIIDRPNGSPPENNLGKIITTPHWTFAAAAPAETLEWVKPGQPVTLSFDAINQKIPATIQKVFSEKDNERVVMLFSCNYASGALFSLRGTQAVVSFDQYTGLRINTSELRFVNDRRGVYILDGNTVRFKEISPIYEEEGFVLSKPAEPNSRDETYVRLFDQIIKGKDLYDGKVLQ